MNVKAVLVLDDDSAVRSLLLDALQNNLLLEIVLHHTGSLAEALRLVSEVTFDVVITDINLGFHPSDLDGLDLIRRIREQKASTFIFCISGCNEMEKEALQAGANVFFEKPFKINDFLTVVTNVVRER